MLSFEDEAAYNGGEAENMTYPAKELSREQKHAVESLLGRTLRDDEEISVVASRPQAMGAGPRHRHISEVIAENMRDVPSEVLATLPEDGASEHDHYIYGFPKRNG